MIEDYFKDMDNTFADNPKDKLIIDNLKLVVSIALKYQNQGLSLEDLIQEGNLGLMVAAQRFDTEQGYKFTTYATYWIKRYIISAIDIYGREIRLPANIIRDNQKIESARQEYYENFGIAPTNEELEKITELDVEKILSYTQITPVSLFTPIGKEDEGYLGEILEDDISLSPLEYVLLREEEENLRANLNSLPEKERKVIWLRFFEERTLKDTGKKLNLTSERVRQLERRAIRKLRILTN